ncbi:hypothetical protein RugamoR57_41130 [Duganella caerulea]
MRFNRRDQGGHVGDVAEVGHEKFGFDTMFGQFDDSLLQRFAATRDQGDAIAFASESVRQRSAEAAAGTKQHDGFFVVMQR